MFAVFLFPRTRSSQLIEVGSYNLHGRWHERIRCLGWTFPIIATLGGGFKYVWFSSLFGEESHCDSYFSDGLKSPTRTCLRMVSPQISPKVLMITQGVDDWNLGKPPADFLDLVPVLMLTVLVPPERHAPSHLRCGRMFVRYLGKIPKFEVIFRMGCFNQHQGQYFSRLHRLEICEEGGNQWETAGFNGFWKGKVWGQAQLRNG